MLDAPLRARLDAPLARAAKALDRPWISPDRITTAGLLLGLGSAATAAAQLWAIALLLWLLSRLADGLDGPLARLRAQRSGTESGAGGFYDITADFVVYGTTVVGVAIGASAAYGVSLWPFLLVLLAYYLNGAAFLAFSSIAERHHRTLDDGRSLSFLGGLAEGTETIIVHSLWLILPMLAWHIAIGWAAIVGITAAWRIHAGYQALR
ncbi:CDP-alcohol phosphatidyltransferase family protein [Lolliginicoccus suaedae]|uniref:CDP-alcohol phosphatidyltransferase family protein n=1 Tax=Lolliginicoccus suaedae TaxID=2605429 RepID=UPI0011ED7382|nr:CDP-alcohol phosphatidyltransferase family protein [Lolliginicoccus suaedae]